MNFSDDSKTNETSSNASRVSEDSLVSSSGTPDHTNGMDDNSEGSELQYHISEMSNTLEINRNHTLSQCIDMSAMMLRVHGVIEIRGVGVNIPTAVTLIEALKKRGLAMVTSIKTGMNITEHMICQGSNQWSRPSTMMRFSLTAGEFAEYITGWRQRKIIELFEKFDDCTGELSVNVIKSFDLGKNFFTSAKNKRKAANYLKVFEKKNEKLNLPNFIEYASLIIHPLLKKDIFESAVSELMH